MLVYNPIPLAIKKRVFFLWPLFFLNLTGYSQPVTLDSIAEKIIRYYNNDQYDQLYDLLSDDFKKQFPKDAHNDFYKNNLKAAYGKIVSKNKTKKSVNSENYLITFEGGDLNMAFVTDQQLKIAGIQWTPPQAEELQKRNISNLKSNNPSVSPLEKKIDSLALNFLENNNTCGLSIGIINGTKTDRYFYGETRKGNATLPGSTTLYEIGSITKTFTGIVLANAINAGKLKAEDDIRNYLGNEYTNLNYKGNPIRIKHLANHTSLLPPVPMDLEKQPGYNPLDPYKNYSREMLLAYLKTLTFDTLPGTQYQYSNLGVAVLGIILEKVYNIPLEKIYSSIVTSPCKMTNTKMILTVNDSLLLATGNSGKDGTEVPYWNFNAVAAAGALKSNLDDMILYLEENMKEKNKDILLSHAITYEHPEQSIGLAWVISPAGKNQTFIWHNGRTSGFSSLCGFVKGKNTGIVVLTNSGMSCDELGFAIIREMMKP